MVNPEEEHSRQPSINHQVWYLIVDDHQEGPYSYLELSKDARLTPETLAWRDGMVDWLPIADIDELKHLFGITEKEGENREEAFEESILISDDELVLDMRKGGPNPLIWIVLILFVIFYIIYEYLWP